MHFKLPFVSFLILALGAATVQSTDVKFYTTRSCAGPASFEFKDPGCNKCFDPPFDWFAVQFSDIASNQRVSIHNQNKCTSKSSTGQTFGPVCFHAGKTALRSAWVACPGQKLTNGTETTGNITATVEVGSIPIVVVDDA